MAGTSLLLLIDDITLMLDDVAAMSKLAAKKPAGVLGDDLALNAQQVTGIRAAKPFAGLPPFGTGCAESQADTAPTSSGDSCLATAAMQSGSCAWRLPDFHAPS